MLNSLFLVGSLGADPNVFYSSEGNPVASFSLAFHAGKNKTRWIKVTAFHKLAEIVRSSSKEESKSYRSRSS
jgi:single-strand DNA-binding protein